VGDALPEMVELYPPGVAHLGFNLWERTNGTYTCEMVLSAQEILSESTCVAVHSSSRDVCDENFLSNDNAAQSIGSKLAGVGVECVPSIGRARMVEPRGHQTDSGVVSIKSE